MRRKRKLQTQIVIMHKFFYLLFSVLLLTACDQPINVLDVNDMAAVLADIHIAEAAMNNQISYANADVKRAYYEGIFDKHGTSHSTFTKSVDWYSRNPKYFEEVYTKTLEIITEKQEKVNNYAYHPELNPAFLNLIDSLDLWVRSPKIVVKSPVADSLYFELNDAQFFCAGDKYVWRFLQHVEGFDTLPQSKLKIVIEYPHQICDSVVYALPDKQTHLRYTVRLKARDSIAPQRIFGWFYTASLDSVRRVSVDSISLVRFYNKETHPLDSAVLHKLKALRKVHSRLSETTDTTVVTTSSDEQKLHKAVSIKRADGIRLRSTKSKRQQ